MYAVMLLLNATGLVLNGHDMAGSHCIPCVVIVMNLDDSSIARWLMLVKVFVPN